ncbi:penicillin acylase family protein [Bacillus salitolerans]|uniref:Penicillin acylase family protein n=1 Tax=Bacillus salitolerans TaxID=1437434 RepID=A0ABW4LUZ8_9BACI
MEVIVKKRVKRWPATRKWQITLSIVLGIVFLLACAAGYFFWLLGKSAPKIEGTLEISGLTEEVTVYRDSAGVPHIEAQNIHDLYFAQGFVTAQDRIFQMDLSRRQASGQLSEVVGAKAIDRDRFFRTLGLRRAAEASFDMYSDEAKQTLSAYAAGVNAYIKEAKESNSFPIEFTILGYEPTEWTEIDSLAIGKYMAFDLGGHWEGQAFRAYLLKTFPEEKALDLFVSYPEDGPTIIQAVKGSDIDFPKSFASSVIPHEFNGSNNWVVSGEKSASGFPLLADDPHLGLATPAIWYETHLQSPELNVSGVIFAGIPGIILGRNDHISWGVTNVGPDVQDLYIEKRNPENKHEFLYNDEWIKADVITETIHVKNQDSIDHEVVITRHGPILSEFAHYDETDTALALRWTALDPSPELEAVLQFSKATDWEEFKEALTLFHTPAQNFVFASTDGTIAYRANGLIPIRKNGDSMLPVPGWTDEYEWTGYIPWDELPTIINPEEGFISTANNKVVGDDYRYHITHTWAQPYRQDRIREFLLSKETFTADDMMKLQFDHHNLQAEEFVPMFEKYLKNDSLRDIDIEALALLETWDFTDRIDHGAPLLFHFWMEEIANYLFHDDIHPDMLPLFDGKAQVVDQLLRKADKGEPGPWMEEKGGLETVLHESLKLAVDRAADIQGKSPAKWKWGELHAVTFAHPLSSVKPLNVLFNSQGAIPMQGSRITVGAAGWNSTTGQVTHGAAWRSVIDMKNPKESYNVVGPGQSGHVSSKWYQDQMDDWTTGGYHLTVTDGSYREDSSRLLLIPSEEN